MRRRFALLMLLGTVMFLSFQWRITLPDLSLSDRLRKELVRRVPSTVRGVGLTRVCGAPLPPPPTRQPSITELRHYKRLLRSQLSRDALKLRTLMQTKSLRRSVAPTVTVVLEYAGRALLCAQLGALTRQTERARAIWVVAMGAMPLDDDDDFIRDSRVFEEVTDDSGADAREVVASFGLSAEKDGVAVVSAVTLPVGAEASGTRALRGRLARFQLALQASLLQPPPATSWLLASDRC